MTKIKLKTFYNQVRNVNKDLSKESIEHIYYALLENDSHILEKSYKENRGEYVGRNYYEVSSEQLEEIKASACDIDDIGYTTNLKNGNHLMAAF